MSQATLSLSKKANAQGEFPVIVRLDISRTNRPQFKSQIAIKPDYFEEGEIKVPMRGKLNAQLRETLIKRKADLEAFVASINAIAMALPEEARNRKDILDVYETVKSLNPSEISKTTIMAKQKEQSEANAQLVAKIREASRLSFLDYIRVRLQGMKDGTIKRKGNNYKKGTVDTYKKLLKILEVFSVDHPCDWEDIDSKLIDSFILFLEERNNMKKTINKQLASFSALLGWAFKDGYPVNSQVLNSFPKLKVNSEDMVVEIYLTEDELQALYDMRLTGSDADVRDVFLVGCYTSQRFSDYSRINESNLSTHDGVGIVTLTQLKTGNEVSIPILDDKLLRILKRRNFNLPRVSHETLNHTIKDICRRLSRKVPSLRKEVATVITSAMQQKEEESGISYKRNAAGLALVPRYELVSSHTARRTGITLMYKSKLLDTYEMMSISGHKTEEVFRDYIKLSRVEMAANIGRKVANAKKEEQAKAILLQQFQNMSTEQLAHLLEIAQSSSSVAPGTTDNKKH